MFWNIFGYMLVGAIASMIYFGVQEDQRKYTKAHDWCWSRNYSLSNIRGQYICLDMDGHVFIPVGVR